MIEAEFHLEESAVASHRVSSAETPASGYEVTLIDVLTQLALRKWLIIGITVIAALVGALISLILPVRFTAATKIMPPQQTQSAASMMMNQLANSGAGSLASLAGGSLGLKNPNDIYVSLLTSRPVEDGIIKRFALRSVYHSRDMTSARKTLAGYTAVSVEKGGLISISVIDRDKTRVAALANAYVEELRLLTKSLAVTEASQRRLFYEEQLKEAKESMLAAERLFQLVQQSKGLVALDAQAKAMIEGMAALRAQVAAKQVQVQALRSYSTERNPDLELAERELSSLQTEAERLEQRGHSPGSSHLGLQDVSGTGMDYLRAEHDVKYRQALFDLLIKQYDAAKLDESKEASIIQVVEPAIEPERRSSPKRTLMVLLFIFGGLGIGCLTSLLLWWKEVVIQSDPLIARQVADLKRALMIVNRAGH